MDWNFGLTSTGTELYVSVTMLIVKINHIWSFHGISVTAVLMLFN